MKIVVLSFLCLLSLSLTAQKKPLDHSVYDGWQSIGERIISHDGKWVVYTVTPQEGDADLYVASVQDTSFQKKVPRGYNAVITEDSRYLVFRIRPLFKDTREARIKKKKPEDFPRDSIGIMELGKDSVMKFPRVNSFKTPRKAAGWVAYHKEKPPMPARSQGAATQKTVDSLKKTVDSLVLLVTQLKNIKGGHADNDADEEPNTGGAAAEGSDLVLRNLKTGKEKTFRNVIEYHFNDLGQKLLMRVSRSRDSGSANAVIVYQLDKGITDTILKGGNDFRNFTMTEDGSRIAFLAERDTAKAAPKTYGLYLYRNNDDSAALLIDKKSEGMQLGMTVSEHGTLQFSKSGRRLFFGTAAVPAVKDTSLIDIDLVKLDIWHYNDDYLQSQQLFQLNNELRRSYLAVYDFENNQMNQLGSRDLPTVMQSNEGDGNYFVAITDTGRRVALQWTGRVLRDVYAFQPATGKLTLVKKNLDGMALPSASGNYILLYDMKARHYFCWDGTSLKNISAGIRVPLYDELHDRPEQPTPYGIMGWHQGDSAVYVYDRYDIWKLDPQNKKAPVLMTTGGRKSGITTRYVSTNPEKRFFTYNDTLSFRLFSHASKKSAYAVFDLKNIHPQAISLNAAEVSGLAASKNGNSYIFSSETYEQSPDLYVQYTGKRPAAFNAPRKLSALNPQQSEYNWGTAELYHWTAFNGKKASGILYKPEDFDPSKKYPVIFYFYERHTDDLYSYIPPAPTGSRINVPFFVSRGYLVLLPDIHYTRGHPGKDAYTYVVSAAQSLSRQKWVDAANMGIQGQSWGGYQVAYLITATNMFKAAWAGAPVVNMFSAYGGIRWQGGVNRQFQYEQTQSRIGATPWERPDLYIENSPFFHLKKVKTPLVIMANDADGAVPWYQGIEFFTAMRRLGKKVWMLNYNGEAHNLVERKNKKDIQIRQQQFFDWLLKGEPPARWINEGVPAVRKGRDWGLE